MTTGDELRAIAARHEAAAPAMAEIQRLISDPAFKAAVRDPRSLQDHRDIGVLLDLLRSVPDQVQRRELELASPSRGRVSAWTCVACEANYAMERSAVKHSPGCPAPLLDMIRR